jgi:multiple sugar transport system permease protein
MKKHSGQIIKHIVLWLFVIISIIPFLSMISTSFSQAMYELPYPPRILPDTVNFANYAKVIKEDNFARYFLNSVFLSTVVTVCVLFISAMSAYGFARFDFPFKKVVFNLYLFTMMVPGVLNLIAQYSVISRMHLVNTYTGILLLMVGGGIAGNTFFLRGFFEDIPHELEESVVIDGGGRWCIFWHIVLPLSKPALGTLGIGIFSGVWSDFFTVLTFIKDSDKWTLPVALQLLRGEHATEWGLVMAASVLLFIPELIMFIIVQKNFVQSVGGEGAVKG